MSSNRGNALAMALVGTLAVGIMAVVLLQRSKTETKIGKRLGADNDIEIAVSTIAATLASPSNCTATFKGLPIGAVGTSAPQDLPMIKVCTSGTCRATGGPAADYMGKETTLWRLIRETPPATLRPTNARIKDIKYQLIKAQQRQTLANTAPWVGILPAIARVYVTFEKNLGASNQAAHTSSGGNITGTTTTHDKVYIIDAMVVTGTQSGTTITNNTGNIISGCPRSSGSTAVY